MDARRSYALALTGLVAGGGLVLVVAQAGWVVARTREAGFDSSFAGSVVVPAAVPCALVAVAGAVGVVATRGVPRRVVGLLLALVGLALSWLAVSVLFDPAGAVRGPLAAVTGGASAAAPQVVSLAWWWCLLAAAGGLAIVAAGALTGVRGGGWAVMSARYDGPAGTRRRAATPRTDPWSLLDRGEDPTLDGDGPAPAPPAPDLQQ